MATPLYPIQCPACGTPFTVPGAIHLHLGGSADDAPSIDAKVYQDGRLADPTGMVSCGMAPNPTCAGCDKPVAQA